MSKRVQLIIAILAWLAALALIAWVISSVPLGEVLTVISRLRVWQIAVILFGNLLLLICFAGRWWAILQALGWSLSLVDLTLIRIAAFGISYFTPGSHFGGEPLQVYLAARRHYVPMPTAAASVALEKLIELVGNFSILAMGIAVTLQSPIFADRPSGPALAISLGLLALPIGFLAAVWSGIQPISWVFRLLPFRFRTLPRLAGLKDSITHAEQDAITLCRERPLGLIFASTFSLLSWVGMLVEMWLVAYFLGTPLTPLQLIAIMTASRIAMLLPSPGGLGTLEASQVWVFETLGLDPALGLTFTLVIRARDLLFGLFGLWWGAKAVRDQGKSKTP